MSVTLLRRPALQKWCVHFLQTEEQMLRAHSISRPKNTVPYQTLCDSDNCYTQESVEIYLLTTSTDSNIPAAI
ncbi:hypothetical protein T4D_707 [Trichinella pseudospiralis]|uniref:Uncharacterized protein n=1 Tax=Trichinella pseudospiralis TaxID=6337 RepID=A0A0V1FF52_TRIPS|nr:hypothetical protein T4D_707 [Trichinella pseudospiralis]